MNPRKMAKKLDKLDELTLETCMLIEVMDDALKLHEHKEGICSINHLSGMIKERFRHIRAVF